MINGFGSVDPFVYCFVFCISEHYRLVPHRPGHHGQVVHVYLTPCQLLNYPTSTDRGDCYNYKLPLCTVLLGLPSESFLRKIPSWVYQGSTSLTPDSQGS